MGSNVNRKRPVVEKPKCVRCGEYIFNEFRQQPWCVDCGLELQEMSFDGEEVLELFLSVMPPMPPHPSIQVKVLTVLRIARRGLVEFGLLKPNDEQSDSDGDQIKKSPILLG